MADTYISMQQATPNGSVESVLYTCPAATSFVASSLIATNTNGSPVTIRVRIGIGGAGTSTKQYLFYDLSMAANATLTLTAGLTMVAGDVMYVFANSTGVAFQLGGVQIT